MPTVKDWKPGSTFSVLPYGRSGAGKTFGAGTFPRPIFMDFDAGIATLRHPAFVKEYGVRDITYEQFKESDITKGGVVRAHHAFDNAFLFFEKMQAAALKDTFDTWVIDTCTSLSEIALNKALIFMGGQKLSQTHSVAMVSGVVVPKIQDFGAERSLVEQFVSMVLSSGKNVVCLCHEKEIFDDAGNRTGIVPLLTGRGVEAIAKQFDEVYNVQAVRRGPDTLRQCLTETDGTRMAKSRIGIPNYTAWNWPAISAEINKIAKAQEPKAP